MFYLRLNPHWHSIVLGSTEREPALASLAAAAVTGLAPAGPELRKRPPIALRDESGLRIAAGLSASEAGFSLHAATTAPAHDARVREALCKYVLRPPLAQERLRLLEDGLVRIQLKRALPAPHRRADRPAAVVPRTRPAVLQEPRAAPQAR